MKKYYPSKCASNILRVIAIIILCVLIVTAWIYLSAYPIIMWAAIILFCVMFILFFILVPIYFSRTCYYFSANEISKQSGFFIESQQLIRVSSIQYFTRLATPFSKHTGFNFIKLNALGGFLVLPFLAKNDADEIADALADSIMKSQV